MENLNNKECRPKVSICVITYNHEKYIEQCLQSLVDQVTDFDYEIIVGEDCSTDGTRAVVEKFVRKYPEKVRLILNTTNIGPTQNYIRTHGEAKGEYIAHCDGDDLWHQDKLQYQADILDKNPEISQCWGCADLIDDNGKNIGIFPSRLARLFNPKYVYANDIALSYQLVGQHSTQMYRKKFKPTIDPNEPVLDYWIAFNISLAGPCYYSKNILGSYRVTKLPSVTRHHSSKKIVVDILSKHLVDICKEHPEYIKEAKANITTRLLFSKLANHNLDELNKNIIYFKSQKTSINLVIKAIFYFIMQKLRF